MKISFNWLKDYIQTNKAAEEVGDILTSTGLEVEHLDKYESIKGGLNGLVVGLVKACEPHSNADSLNICKVDVGGDEDLNIVCGAPNVAEGQKVVVATVNTTIHPLKGAPFTIKKAKIRGEESFGMICAEDEIGLGESHDGIMVLDYTYEVGQPITKYFEVKEDYVFEIGLTPNRSDGISHYGVARDLAAYLQTHETQGNAQLPSIDNFKEGSGSKVSINIEDKEACVRYMGISLTNVKVGNSPQWLKDKLETIGLRPINNIVDITNFVQHECGQPLHAFDEDKIAGNKVIVKCLAEGTAFTTLDDIERELNEKDLMICNGQEGMCIAGVFGGAKSGVTNQTTNIFLESATFNATSIRKTASRHGLSTDASYRYERGADVNMAPYALKRAALLFEELAGAKVSSAIEDVYPNKVLANEIEVDLNRINRLIGVDVAKEKSLAILKNLGFEILSDADAIVKVKVPSYRVEVTREADVAEEILRIYGFNNVPELGKLNASINNYENFDKDILREKTADLLCGLGFNENISNPITKNNYVNEVLKIDEALQIRLQHTANSELDTLRPTLLVSALENVLHNINHFNKNLRFFEIGKRYWKNGDEHLEAEMLSLTITGNKNIESWNADNKAKEDFYGIKAAANQVLRRLGIDKVKYKAIEHPHYNYALQLMAMGKDVGIIGEVNKNLLKSFGIKQTIYAAELQFEVMMNAIAKSKTKFKAIPKFPGSRRDLALVIDRKVNYSELEKIAKQTDQKLLKAVNIFDVYEDDKLGDNKKSYALSFDFQNEQKTLTDEDIDAVMQKLMSAYKKQVGAEIR